MEALKRIEARPTTLAHCFLLFDLDMASQDDSDHQRLPIYAGVNKTVYTPSTVQRTKLFTSRKHRGIIIPYSLPHNANQSWNHEARRKCLQQE